jgi:hypothetical protein
LGSALKRNVGTSTVQGNTVRLRRVVVETPVERQVSLLGEKMIVEHRKPTAASKGQDVLTEKVVETIDILRSSMPGRPCGVECSAHR